MSDKTAKRVAKRARKGHKPQRRVATKLNPEWLQGIFKTAIKYKANIQIHSNGEVTGLLEDMSTGVRYPENKEWTDEILNIYPNGATITSIGRMREHSMMAAYSSVELAEGATATIDATTGCVQLDSGGVKLRSCMIMETTPTPILIEGDVEYTQVDFASIPKAVMSAMKEMVARSSQNVWGRINALAMPYGSTAIIANASTTLLIYEFELPTIYATFSQNLDLTECTEYGYQLRYRGDDENGDPTHIVQFFKMADCTVVEIVLIPHDRLLKIPGSYVEYDCDARLLFTEDQVSGIQVAGKQFATGFGASDKIEVHATGGKVRYLVANEVVAEIDLDTEDNDFIFDLNYITIASKLGASLYTSVFPKGTYGGYYHNDGLHLGIAAMMRA